MNDTATGDDYSFAIIDEVVFGNGVKHGYSEAAGHGMLDVYAALQPIVSAITKIVYILPDRDPYRLRGFLSRAPKLEALQ